MGLERCTDSDVRIDARVSCGAGQVLVLAVGNMLVAPGITVLLRKAKVNDVDHVLTLAQPDLGVARF